MENKHKVFLSDFHVGYLYAILVASKLDSLMLHDVKQQLAKIIQDTYSSEFEEYKQ